MTWREAVSADGEAYFYNETTGESQWQCPEPEVPISPRPPLPLAVSATLDDSVSVTVAKAPAPPPPPECKAHLDAAARRRRACCGLLFLVCVIAWVPALAFSGLVPLPWTKRSTPDAAVSTPPPPVALTLLLDLSETPAEGMVPYVVGNDALAGIGLPMTHSGAGSIWVLGARDHAGCHDRVARVQIPPRNLLARAEWLPRSRRLRKRTRRVPSAGAGDALTAGPAAAAGPFCFGSCDACAP